jgi:hypothetical protein
VIGNAVHVMRIATGEIEDAATAEPARKIAVKGGKARAAALAPERRAAIDLAALTRQKIQTETLPPVGAA